MDVGSDAVRKFRSAYGAGYLALAGVKVAVIIVELVDDADGAGDAENSRSTCLKLKVSADVQLAERKLATYRAVANIALSPRYRSAPPTALANAPPADTRRSFRLLEPSNQDQEPQLGSSYYERGRVPCR